MFNSDIMTVGTKCRRAFLARLPIYSCNLFFAGFIEEVGHRELLHLVLFLGGPCAAITALWSQFITPCCYDYYRIIKICCAITGDDHVTILYPSGLLGIIVDSSIHSKDVVVVCFQTLGDCMNSYNIY